MPGPGRRLEDVALAGLLHDVGKIRQRVPGTKGDHQRLGAELLKEAFGGAEGRREELGLAVLAAAHHHQDHLGKADPDGLGVDVPDDWPHRLAVVALADTIASAERNNELDREEGNAEYSSRWTLYNPWHRIQGTFSKLLGGNAPEGVEWKEERPEFVPGELPLLHLTVDPTEFRPPENRGSLDHPKEKEMVKEAYRNLDRRLVELLRDLNAPDHPFPFDPARVALEVTGSLVPAQHYVPEGRDHMRAIPLYDHCALTATFATCIQALIDDGALNPGPDDPEGSYRALSDGLRRETPFLLVRGSLKGIGEFIRSVRRASPLEGEVPGSYLKLIRGRSAAIDVITAGAAWTLLEETLGDSAHPAMIVRAVGGSFTLLIPALEGVEEVLEEVGDDIDESLLGLTDGVLSLGLAWTSFGPEDVFDRGRFHRKVVELEGRLAESLERRKARPGRKCGGGKHDPCPACGRPVSEERCDLCATLAYIGGVMVRRDRDGRPRLAGYVVGKGIRGEEGSIEILRGKGYACPVESDNVEGAARVGDLILADPAHVERVLGAVGRDGPRVVMTYIPWYAATKRDVGEDDGEGVATFEGMAEAAPGAGLLGLAYLDVDNLGGWMRLASRDSLGVMVAVSRLADLVFRHWVNALGFRTAAQILRDVPKLRVGSVELDPTDHLPRFGEDGEPTPEHGEGTGRPFLIAYSGGDDLLVIGAWNEALSIPFEAFLLFSHATGYSPLASASGAVLFTRRKAPFHIVLRDLKRAEREAKEAGEEGSRYLLDPKGTVRLPRLPEAGPVPLPAVFEAVRLLKRIKGVFEGRRSRVHRLLRALGTWWRSGPDDPLRAVSKLTYVVSRIDKDDTLSRTLLDRLPPCPDRVDPWAPIGLIDVVLVPYFLATKRG